MAAGTIPVSGVKLLWENPNTGTDFSSTEISNSGGYAVYLILYKMAKTASSYTTVPVVAVSNADVIVPVVSSPTAGTPVVSYRTVNKNVNTGRITIGNCQTREVTATSRTQDNSLLIPVRVFGVI